MTTKIKSTQKSVFYRKDAKKAQSTQNPNIFCDPCVNLLRPLRLICSLYLKPLFGIDSSIKKSFFGISKIFFDRLQSCKMFIFNVLHFFQKNIFMFLQKNRLIMYFVLKKIVSLHFRLNSLVKIVRGNEWCKRVTFFEIFLLFEMVRNSRNCIREDYVYVKSASAFIHTIGNSHNLEKRVMQSSLFLRV